MNWRRHLAEKWSGTYIAPHTKRRLTTSYQETEMSTIEHLILLDLLGAAHPLIHSSFIDTAWLFDEMASAEQRLSSSGAFAYEGDNNLYTFFAQRTGKELWYGHVEDDHIPFLKKGVDVLHVIANPFPRVWHTLKVSPYFFLRNPSTQLW